jgi:hypothetical protein
MTVSGLMSVTLPNLKSDMCKARMLSLITSADVLVCLVHSFPHCVIPLKDQNA